METRERDRRLSRPSEKLGLHHEDLQELEGRILRKASRAASAYGRRKSSTQALELNRKVIVARFVYRGESLSNISRDFDCTESLLRARMKRWGIETSLSLTARNRLPIKPSHRAINRSDLIEHLEYGARALAISSGHSLEIINDICRFHCVARKKT